MSEALSVQILLSMLGAAYLFCLEILYVSLSIIFLLFARLTRLACSIFCVLPAKMDVNNNIERVHITRTDRDRRPV